VGRGCCDAIGRPPTGDRDSPGPIRVLVPRQFLSHTLVLFPSQWSAALFAPGRAFESPGSTQSDQCERGSTDHSEWVFAMLGALVVEP
jgi:hypothetical protein